MLIQIIGGYDYFEFDFNRLQNLPAPPSRVLPIRPTASKLECSKKQNRIKSSVLIENL